MHNKIANLRAQVEVLKFDKEVIENRVQRKNKGDEHNDIVKHFEHDNLCNLLLHEELEIKQLIFLIPELEEEVKLLIN